MKLKSLLLVLLLAAPMIAQRPALVPPVVRFSDNNGKPLAGGKLFSYQAGTTTPLPTFADSTTGAVNSNPVILDSTGSAPVFLGTNVYKFVLQNSAGVVQWTADNVAQGGFESTYVNSVFGRTGVVTAHTGDYACSQVTGAICSIPNLYNQTIQVAGGALPQEPILNFIPGVSGGINTFTITAGGSGYTGAPTVTFTGGACATEPTGSSVVAGGIVTSGVIVTSGAGCTSPPTPNFSGGGGSGATGATTLYADGIVCVDNPSHTSTDCTFTGGGGSSGGTSVVNDVTFSRAYGTVYQNTNTVPLLISVTGAHGSSMGCTESALIGPTSTPTTPYGAQSVTPTTSAPASGSQTYLVPASYYYQEVTDFCALTSWVEATLPGGSGGSSISLTTTGTSGPATLISNVLNIPIYTGGGSGGPNNFPGTAHQFVTSYNSGTQNLAGAQPVEADVVNLVSDLAGKQQTLTLTTTGSSGPATLSGGALNIPQYTGGGGATLPFPGIVFATSGSGGRVATYTDMGNAVSNTAGSLDNTYLTTTVPTNPGGNNVLVGVGVGGNLNGAIVTGVSGNSDTYVGFNAGASATSAREDTFIGNQAGANVTGNGSGPDDMIFDLIGSEAGGALTNCGSSGVMIGQKAGVLDTCSDNDVFLGIHSATQVTTSSANVVIGAEAMDSYTGTIEKNVLIGNFVADPSAGGDINNTVAVGFKALQFFNGTISGGNTGNVALGYEAGLQCTGCVENVFVGDEAGGSGGTPGFTGHDNIFMGHEPPGTSALTSASNNVYLGVIGYGLTSGTNNISIGHSANAPITSGGDNISIGNAAAAQSLGTISDSINIGFAAGFKAQQGQQTFIGYQTGLNLNGSAAAKNVVMGYDSLLNCVTCQSNTIIGWGAGTTPTTTESSNVIVGASADVALGVSSSAQIGTGQNTISHTMQFNGFNFLTDSGAAKFASAAISGLTSGNCVQASTGGLLTTTGAACGSGGSGPTLQTNGTNNTSQSALNFITSTTNATGLIVTPSNPATSSEKMEITGALTFDNVGSGTNLGHGLVCGTGCVFTTAGTGINNANELNGTLLSGLATGLLKNTTSTGVPSIATPGTDYLLPSGSGASLTGITLAQVAAGTAPASSGTYDFANNPVTTHTTTTVSTSSTATSGANFNSPNFTLTGSYWTGSAAATDNWLCKVVLGTGANPTSGLSCAHTGSTGFDDFEVPNLTITGVGIASSPVYQLTNGVSGTISIQAPGGALGTVVLTAPDTTGTIALHIASGTSVLGTAAIASGACATTVTTTATGTATTDVVGWGFNGSTNAVTGYAPTVNGMLTIKSYPSAGSVNFDVCNNTAASVTPGAITLNWTVIR